MKYCSVKRAVTFTQLLKLFLIPVLTVVLAFIVPPILFYIVLIAGMLLAIILTPSFLNSEYEYAIEGDTFSVAIIKAKSSRKEIFSCDIQFLQSCVPYSNQNLGSTQVTALSKENTPFVARFSEDGKEAFVLFSPSAEFLNELYLLAPSKVKRNIM